MTNPGPLWKCECEHCNCEEAAVNQGDPEIKAICDPCGRGIHRAEREYKASIETRKRIAKEEQELKKRED